METGDSPPPSPPLSECYPETLSVETVKESLRRFGVPFAPDASHDHLKRLYREFLSPKTQRTNARSNRRGQQIQIKQIRQEKSQKRRAEFSNDSSASSSKNLKYTTAESVNNALHFKGGGSSLNFAPVNGSMKPTPGSTSSSSTDSRAKHGTRDSLSHIKINEGPRKSRNEQRGGNGGGDDGSGKDGSCATALSPTKTGKFWNMFGSISHHVTTTSSDSMPSTDDKSKKPNMLETGLNRLKLNRKTVLPHQLPANCINNVQQQQQNISSTSSASSFSPRPSSPLNDSPKSAASSKSASPMNGSPRLSRIDKISFSDSGSDMEVCEVASTKSATIAKITWP